jgi:uncharacterized repeat protein (TIGR01451 family)
MASALLLWSGSDDRPAMAQPGGADLAVTKSASHHRVRVGADLVYTISVTNKGPATATGVTLIDTLPEDVNLVSFTPGLGQGCYSPEPHNVTCDLPSLASGESRVITVVVRPTAPGKIRNVASVAGVQEDPKRRNNTDTLKTKVGD